MKGKGSSGERTQRDEIIAFAREQYGAEPEYPWEKLLSTVSSGTGRTANGTPSSWTSQVRGSIKEKG